MNTLLTTKQTYIYTELFILEILFMLESMIELQTNFYKLMYMRSHVFEDIWGLMHVIGLELLVLINYWF